MILSLLGGTPSGLAGIGSTWLPGTTPSPGIAGRGLVTAPSWLPGLAGRGEVTPLSLLSGIAGREVVTPLSLLPGLVGSLAASFLSLLPGLAGREADAPVFRPPWGLSGRVAVISPILAEVPGCMVGPLLLLPGLAGRVAAAPPPLSVGGIDSLVPSALLMREGDPALAPSRVFLPSFKHPTIAIFSK